MDCEIHTLWKFLIGISETGFFWAIPPVPKPPALGIWGGASSSSLVAGRRSGFSKSPRRWQWSRPWRKSGRYRYPCLTPHKRTPAFNEECLILPSLKSCAMSPSKIPLARSSGLWASLDGQRWGVSSPYLFSLFQRSSLAQQEIPWKFWRGLIFSTPTFLISSQVIFQARAQSRRNNHETAKKYCGESLSPASTNISHF